MAAMGKGGKKTPPRVVELIKEEVAKIGQNATARAIVIPLYSVQKYMVGESEPTQASLEKLAAYFLVSVPWLRGGSVGPLERLIEGFKLTGVAPGDFNRKMYELLGEGGGDIDYWRSTLAGNLTLTPSVLVPICASFKIDLYWVETGRAPTILTREGFVGTVTETSKRPPWLNSGVVPKAAAFITSGPPLLVCAICGGELKRDDRDEECTLNAPLRIWPCATCCKQ